MPATQEEINRLAAKLDQIMEVDPQEKLVRPDLGDASFEDAIPVLERTLSLFRTVHLSDWQILPQQVIQNFNHWADQVLKWIAEADRFDLKRSGSVQQRDDMIDGLDALFEKLISELGPYISHLLWERNDLGVIEAKARAKMRDLEELTSAQHQEQEGIVAEMRSTLQAAKIAAGEVGVGEQSAVFGDQARKNNRAARLWLALGTVLGVLSLALLWFFLLRWTPSDETTGEIIREFGSRFAVLTLLAFALGFVLRQYAAAKHNETVNRHRQNALRTFETFVKAAGDQETKDAVLLEATRSIFAPQPSGFLRGRNEIDSSNTILEVTRRLRPMSSDN